MKKEYGMAGISVLLWGTLAPVTKLLLGKLPFFEVLYLSSGAAFLLLLGLCFLRGKGAAAARLRPSDWAKLAGLGFLGMFLYNVFYFEGLRTLAAQDACIINYLWPMMTVVFSSFLLREPMTFRKIAAIVLSFAGVAVVAAGGNPLGSGTGSLLGVLSCLAAALCYGLFSALNKRENYDQYLGMTVYFGVTALGGGIGALLAGEAFRPLSWGELAGMAWLGFFVSAAAYLLWGLALSRGDTAKVSNLAYCTPAAALIFSYFILGERIQPLSVLGLSLILLGIFVQMSRKRNLTGG